MNYFRSCQCEQKQQYLLVIPSSPKQILMDYNCWKILDELLMRSVVMLSIKNFLLNRYIPLNLVELFAHQ